MTHVTTSAEAEASPQIQPQYLTIDGLSIRYAESGPHENHALLPSPWPESLFAFAPIWSYLAQHVHLVAVDLPGYCLTQPFATGAMLTVDGGTILA